MFKKHLQILCLSVSSFGFVQLASAAEYELPNSFFADERYGERMVLEPAIQAVMAEWNADPQARNIVIEYGRSEDQADVRAKRISEWLIAFGVDQQSIQLRPKRWLSEVLRLSTESK
jgi:hypothetical protein